MKLMYIFLTSLYLLVVLITYVSTTSSGDIVLKEWKLSEETLKVPFKLTITDATILKLETTFESDFATKAYLILPMILTHGLKVHLNDETVFNALMRGRYTNLWTTTFQFEIDLKRGKNAIVLELQNLYDLKMRWSPYISFEPSWRVNLSNVVENFLPTLSAGLSFSLGVLLMILAHRRKRVYYTYFAHVFTFLAFYLLDMSYIPISLNFWCFTFMKRILFFSLHGLLAFFPMGIDLIFEGSIKRSSRILGYGLLILGAFVLFHPDFYVARTIHFASGPYFLLMSFLLPVKLMKKDRILMLSATFLLISAIQHAFASLGVLPVPSVLGFGVLYVSISFVYFLTVEYRKIEAELLRTRKEIFLDPLTNAFNRRMLDLVDLSENDSVVFFDFDDFKRINDEYGHAYGDELLREFVRVVKSSVRKDDVLIRYGGDEFVLILRECAEEKAHSIVKGIVDKFRSETNVDVSYGVVEIGEGDPVESLAEADMRMYRMKHEKKSQGTSG